MKHTAAAQAAGIALSFALLAACGTTSAPPAGEDSVATTAGEAAPAEESPAAENPGSAPQVTTDANGITVTGSGNGETGPITFDQPYYLVKTTNSAAADFGTVIVTVTGKELPSIMSTTAEDVAVFTPDGTSAALTIEATGGYVLTFGNPPSTAGAVAAPQTFSGAEGILVTPVVKTTGTYVKLSLAYTGTADENAPTGAMLARAQIYDAATGGSVLNVPTYVNKAKTEDSDGQTTKGPGAYFLIVHGTAAEDTWEASITEE